jgi:hypothetical protein
LALALRGRGDVVEARAVVNEMRRHVTPGEVALALVDVAPSLIAGGQYDSIFENLTPASISGPLPFDYFLVKAEYFRLRSRDGPARAYFDSLRVAVNDIAARRTTERTLEVFLTRAFAGVGDRKQASFHAALVEQLIEDSNDQLGSRAMHESLVWVYVQVGNYEAAIDHLEHLMAMPSLISAQYLRVAQLPQGLRDHPRFQQLVNAPVT